MSDIDGDKLGLEAIGQQAVDGVAIDRFDTIEIEAYSPLSFIF